jgi:exopolyphosphatase/guanosine-5'-triphosphate,3'-diphosphate pyrophosphatase
LKLAAIDIGSNAARLLISEAVEIKNTITFNKINLVRVPLRLGFDVFDTGFISKKKIGMLLQTMKAFSHLINVYDVKHVTVCATSAMRDAQNSNDIIRKTMLETGLDIKIISGDEEASIIFENHIAEYLNNDHSYLYIDVGGGSTELTFFSEGKLKYKESFNIGTIRILKNQVEKNDWKLLKDHIKSNTKKSLPISAIGSGGNINKLFSISKKKEGKPITIGDLKEFEKTFSSLSLFDRMQQFKLREDRADVIVPALEIYINVMKWANIQEIFVPKIGLADGLIQNLYQQIISSTK